jgi:hypothetical protein
LLAILRSSLGELFECKTVQEVYEKGEDRITDFLTTLSATSMSSLVNWAALQDNNNIMELQLQGFMVGELHNVLFGVTIHQETVLPTGKRTDIATRKISGLIVRGRRTLRIRLTCIYPVSSILLLLDAAQKQERQHGAGLHNYIFLD